MKFEDTIPENWIIASMHCQYPDNLIKVIDEILDLISKYPLNKKIS